MVCAVTEIQCIGDSKWIALCKWKSPTPEVAIPSDHLKMGKQFTDTIPAIKSFIGVDCCSVNEIQI
jgi:hypothetical protein